MNAQSQIRQTSPTVVSAVTLLAVLVGLAPLSLFMWDCYVQLVESGKMEAQALREEGAARLEKGDTQGAIRKLQASLKLEPDAADAHVMLADALTMTDRTDDAITHYRRGLELNSKQPEAHANLGAALASRGEFAAAEKSLRKALELDPQQPAALINLARVITTGKEVSRKTLAEAVGYAEQACKLTRYSNGPYLAILARLYKRAGDDEKALWAAQRAVALRESAPAMPAVP